MNERLHATVSGRVQGVFYRATTRQRADALGLVGWVRNLPDGRVEALAEGPREVLQTFLDYLWQGPPGARVDEVTADYTPAVGDLAGFEVAR